MTTHRPVALMLDFRSGLPIYIQIMDQIQSQVVGGLLKPGTQLPTVRALAQELRVNFNTVARAYRLLDEAHIISTQQGRGTYVLSKPPPEVEKRLRDENLEALTHRYIREALRLNFTSREITQMIKLQLRSWKESGDRDTE
jgi:GntR family transcriptional regulator